MRVNMVQIKALFLNTFEKEYRNSNLFILFLFTFCIVVAIEGLVQVLTPLLGSGGVEGSLFLSSFGGKLSIFLSILNIWTYIIAIILGTGQIKSDKKAGVMDHILSFPMKKHEYVMIRILSLWCIVIFYYLVSIIFAFLVFSYKGSSLSFDRTVFVNLFFSSWNLLFALTLSSLVSFFFSKIWSFVGTLILLSFIHSANNMFYGQGMAESLNMLEGVKDFIYFIIYNLIPRIGVIGNLHGIKDFSLSVFLTMLHYWVTYILFAIMTIFFFRKKYC